MPGSLRSYRELDAWRGACDLAEAVYGVVAEFPPHERYGLTAQMQRAAVSVPSNLAEGAGRAQPRDFARFVRVASGSLCELRTLIELSQRFRLLDAEAAESLESSADHVARMLYGLLRSLEAAAQRHDTGGQD